MIAALSRSCHRADPLQNPISYRHRQSSCQQDPARREPTWGPGRRLRVPHPQEKQYIFGEAQHLGSIPLLFQRQCDLSMTRPRQSAAAALQCAARSSPSLHLTPPHRRYLLRRADRDDPAEAAPECGGAWRWSLSATETEGLSPRVRGSRHGRLGRQSGEGSIPAGAGEPSRVPIPADHPRVYPRGCGGAVFLAQDSDDNEGLSPRVRGSQAAPQHAAECKGLSPRVRGSLRGCPYQPTPPGSIPAGAGEPSGAA